MFSTARVSSSKRTTRCVLVCCLLGVAAGGRVPAAGDPRGCDFLAWRDVSAFSLSAGDRPEIRLAVSPEIVARLAADEVIASWNADMPPGSTLEIAARALYPDRATKFYVLGRWSSDPDSAPRESVPGQADDAGDVRTDMLVLSRPARRFQVRLRLGAGRDGRWPAIKLLALSFADTTWQGPALPPNRAAWGKVIDVPKRSQLAYVGGEQWCSPASTAMVLAYWSACLARPDLQPDVPEVARWVHDPHWPGTGNWAFNTAFAGAQPGLRAYVTRLSDVAELEDWIAAGLPVVVSVNHTVLQGRAGPPRGHLVVCVGFTDNGDVVVNDPGTRHQVRRIFPRQNLIEAWTHSRRTVYLIQPETVAPPPDRFGHWLAADESAMPKRAGAQ